MTTENDNPSDPTSTDGANIWSIVVALVVLVLASLWFFSYDLPGEKEVGIVDYVLFFNKDLLIFPIVLAFVVYWLIRKFKR
ncbi:MAG: hypothetical protein PVI97_17335 [Candidatus Thiodiazotropha sp.]|jgi:hypothetical protein